MSAQVLVSKTQNRHFGAKVPYLPDRLTYIYISLYLNKLAVEQILYKAKRQETFPISGSQACVTWLELLDNHF